eukprot:COSAG01_NODE_36188_length_521_cov_0.639810_1_plen_95_part_00
MASPATAHLTEIDYLSWPTAHHSHSLPTQIFGSALCEAAFAVAADDDADDDRGDDQQRRADACFLPAPDGTPGLVSGQLRPLVCGRFVLAGIWL